MVKPVGSSQPSHDTVAPKAPAPHPDTPPPATARTFGRGSAMLDSLPRGFASKQQGVAEASSSVAVPRAALPAAGALDTIAAVDEVALRAARHGDIESVHALADEIHALESQLVALQTPVPSPAEDAPEHSQASVQQTIRRLETQRETLARSVEELSKQCEREKEAAERANGVLSKKQDALEQLYENYRSIVSSAAQPSATRDTTAATAHAERQSRIAALEQQINLVQLSRKRATKEAEVVASRDGIRSLGVLSTGTLLFGLGSKALRANVAEWIRGIAQERQRGPRRPVETDADFQAALKHSIERMTEAANDRDVSPIDSLRTFLKLISGTKLQVVGPIVEDALVKSLSRELSTKQTLGLSASEMERMRETYRSTGKLTSQVMANSMIEDFKTEILNIDLSKRLGLPTVTIRGQVLRGRVLTKTEVQLKALVAALEKGKASLAGMIESLERMFVKGLEVDDTEAMGQKVAPKLDGYYKKQLASLGTEKNKLVRERGKAGQSARASSSQSEAPSHTEQLDHLEIRMSRLQGEIEQYAEQHKGEFVRFARSSARHNAASDELEAIERQLEFERGTLASLREDDRSAMAQRAGRGGELESLKRDLVLRWSDAAEHPSVLRLITPAALDRVVRRHVDQSESDMRERVASVGRTGTFSSRAKVLRTIAEVAKHELDKRDSAFVAASPETFERIARTYSEGRIDALCNHGRTIGDGVRKSARGIETSRTGTSQYALSWVDEEGARISHLHPWVSPY